MWLGVSLPLLRRPSLAWWSKHRPHARHVGQVGEDVAFGHGHLAVLHVLGVVEDDLAEHAHFLQQHGADQAVHVAAGQQAEFHDRDRSMSNAPHVAIDPAAFWDDPYPALAAMRREHPIAYVPQLGATLFTRRAHIVELEKLTEVFSSHQPQGLMNRLMGHNMMRKDGAEHIAERKLMLAALGPQPVRTHWEPIFRADAQRVLDALTPRRRADLIPVYAMPVSADALRALSGLTNMRWQDMDAWSQAMIDGIANYAGDPAIEARCHAATAGIDTCISERMPELQRTPDPSLLSVMQRAGLSEASVRANIKLSISGGQNEPRDAIAGAVWALLGPTPNSWHGYSAAMCRGAAYSTSTCAGSRRSR
jgi:cytochrome P450